MKVQIYGKNITVTPAIAEKIEKKLNLLNSILSLRRRTRLMWLYVCIRTNRKSR